MFKYLYNKFIRNNKYSQKKLSPEQELKITEEVKSIKKILRTKTYERQDIIAQNRIDFEYKQTVCNRCGSDKSVNKIITEIKTSTSYPRFIFQQPTKSSYSVNKDISECSLCGNQWKPSSWWNHFNYKRENASYKDLFKDEILYSFPDRFNHFYKDFKEFYAESMHEVFGDVISLEQFKKINKSIIE